jgi:DNA-binding MarR family transcriptional regulator
MSDSTQDTALSQITTAVINELSQQSFVDMLDYLQRSGISLPRYYVLRLLERSPGMTTSALAQQLNLTLGSASQLIDRLEADKLISRQEDHVDRRIRRIFLEPNGLHIINEATQIANHAIINMLAQAPRTLQQEFASVLARLLPYITKETP